MTISSSTLETHMPRQEVTGGWPMATEFTGTGDPARSMVLLWRTPQGAEGTGMQRRRGPKAGLSVDRIVTEAIEVVDTEGFAALSMRRVASALGVGTMSLYTHVPGKGELVDLMFDAVLGELYAGDDDGSAGWRARLEHVAVANWALYRRHPWAVHVATGRP